MRVRGLMLQRMRDSCVKPTDYLYMPMQTSMQNSACNNDLRTLRVLPLFRDVYIKRRHYMSLVIDVGNVV